MNSKIDWSKAPEGATHYGPETEDQYAAWYKEVGGRWMVWVVDRSHGWYREDGLPSSAIARPAEWDGTGLPTVGTKCEVEVYEGEWFGCTVVAHFEGRVVIVLGNRESAHVCDENQLRPIRTAEQIASEEREKACDAMLEIATSERPDPDIYEVIGALYDAGYRKTEQEHGHD